MPISDVSFTNKNKTPSEKLQDLFQKLQELTLEAFFVDTHNKIVIDRNYIEMVLGEHAQQTQNPTSFNKWISLDTKFEKSLKEFQSDLKILLVGIQQMGQAQQTIEQPIANVPAGPSNQEVPPTPPELSRKLPTNKGF